MPTKLEVTVNDVQLAEIKEVAGAAGTTNEKLVQFLMRGVKDIGYRKGHMSKRNQDTREARQLIKQAKEAGLTVEQLIARAAGGKKG